MSQNEIPKPIGLLKMGANFMAVISQYTDNIGTTIETKAVFYKCNAQWFNENFLKLWRNNKLKSAKTIQELLF